MDLLTELKALGADINDGLTRCMNNEALFERLLKKVPENIEKLEVLSFIETGDYATALSNAHTIKGVTGNLSLTPLFTAYSEIVALFRADKPDEARQMLVEILPVQEEIISCIKKYS